MKYDSTAKPLPNIDQVWSWVWAFHPKLFYFCRHCKNYIIPNKPSENCEECGADGRYIVLWVLDKSRGYEQYRTLERQGAPVYASPSKIYLLVQIVSEGHIILCGDIEEDMLNRLTHTEVIKFGKWLNDLLGALPLTILTAKMLNNAVNDYIALGMPI